MTKEEIKQLEKQLAKARKEEENQPVTKAELKEFLKEAAQPQPKGLPAFNINDVPKVPKNYKAVQPQKNIYANIPKKTCAIEVYGHLKKSELVLYGAISSLVVTVVLTVYNPILASVTGFLAAMAGVVYLVKVRTEVNRLRVEYGL